MPSVWNSLKLIVLITALGCGNEAAANEQSLNCIDINFNYPLIENAIKQGPYRYSKALTNQEVINFDYESDNSFAQYIAYAHQLISAKNPHNQKKCPINSPTYQRLTLDNQAYKSATVVDMIAPFELKQENNDKAILLIHGLTDSPFTFHDLAAFFHQQGFTVRTLLLPGHGSSPADLLDTGLNEWQQATQFAIEQTAKGFKQVYLGGYSAGGALIMDYLLQRETVANNIKGLLMWAPAISAKSEMSWLAPYLAKVPFIEWLDKSADINFAKYESFPINAAAQVEYLMEIFTKKDHALYFHDIPMFMVASEDDQTISTQAIISFANRWHSPDERLKTQNDRFIYYGDAQVLKKTLSPSIHTNIPLCRESTDESCNTLLGIAHVAITNAPTNAYYGKKGSYRNCEHYLADASQYLSCKKSKKLQLGEISPENLQHSAALARLTYNPHFGSMLSQLALFLAQTDELSFR